MSSRITPFREGIDTRFGDSFRGLFGKDTGKTMMSATAGSIMGVGEIALLPLDVLKIKAQTNPESLAGRGLFQIVREVMFAAQLWMVVYHGCTVVYGKIAPNTIDLAFHCSALRLLWFFTGGDGALPRRRVDGAAKCPRVVLFVWRFLPC